jgi:hypothetical protein
MRGFSTQIMKIEYFDRDGWGWRDQWYSTERVSLRSGHCVGSYTALEARLAHSRWPSTRATGTAPASPGPCMASISPAPPARP